jgi:ribokinase
MVIGLGTQGSLLKLRDEKIVHHIPAVEIRPIVNTIGAGDALFSGFVHAHLCMDNPKEALMKAAIFAAYKIGERSAAQGFLDSDTLDEMYEQFEPVFDNVDLEN